MNFLRRNEGIYWRQWVGRSISLWLVLSLVFLGLAIFVLGAISCVVTPAYSDLPDRTSFFFFTLVTSLFIYGIGIFVYRLLFTGENLQLFPLMPLTPKQFLRRNAIDNLGILVTPVLILIFEPLIVWLSPHAIFANPAPFSMRQIVIYANVSLTMIALLLYPSMLRLLPHANVWDLFFLARRLLIEIGTMALKALGLMPERRGKCLFIWMAAIALACVLRFKPDFFGDLLRRAIESGVVGRAALFMFSPMSGLVWLSASDMPSSVTFSLAVCLLAANLAMIRVIIRVGSRDMQLIEKERSDQWLDRREAQEAMDEHYMDQYDAQVAQPFQERSAALARQDASEPAASGPVEHDFGNYDPTLDALDLIERENRTWQQYLGDCGAEQTGFRRRNKSVAGWPIAFLIIIIAAINTPGAKPNDSPWYAGATFAVFSAVFLVVLPIVVMLRQTERARAMIVYANLAPMRWRDVLARMYRVGGRRLLLLNVAGGLMIGWLGGGTPFELVAAPVTVLLMQWTAPLVFWLDARRLAMNSISVVPASWCYLGAFVMSIIMTVISLSTSDFSIAGGIMLGLIDFFLFCSIAFAGFEWINWRLKRTDDQVLLGKHLPRAFISLER